MYDCTYRPFLLLLQLPLLLLLICAKLLVEPCQTCKGRYHVVITTYASTFLHLALLLLVGTAIITALKKSLEGAELVRAQLRRFALSMIQSSGSSSSSRRRRCIAPPYFPVLHLYLRL